MISNAIKLLFIPGKLAYDNAVRTVDTIGRNWQCGKVPKQIPVTFWDI